MLYAFFILNVIFVQKTCPADGSISHSLLVYPYLHLLGADDADESAGTDSEASAEGVTVLNPFEEYDPNVS